MKPIVVVGSYNTGLTMSVERLPRPGETVLGTGYSEGPGGKGSNQAIAARRLGGKVTLVARVGKDRYGEEAIALLRKEGVRTEHILRSETHTGVGFVVVDREGTNSIAIDAGANLDLTTKDILGAKDILSTAGVVLLQLEVPLAVVSDAARIAKAGGATVILNPAPAVPASTLSFEAVDILTPNEQEFSTIAGTDEILEGGQGLVHKGPRAVIVTMGERGARVMTADDDYVVPPPRVNAVDTTGAGDAFNGALAVALSEGEPLRQAVTFANFAGAFSVTRKEVVPSLPSREELDDFRRDHDLE